MFHHQLHFDIVECVLDGLVLFDGYDFAEPVGAKQRPMSFTIWEYHHIAPPSHDARKSLQAAAARAGRADLGIVADFITDDGGGEVVQIGDDNTSDFARFAWLAIIVQSLDQQTLALHVIDRKSV